MRHETQAARMERLLRTLPPAVRGMGFGDPDDAQYAHASDVVAWAINEIDRLRDERRWIPVEERLPEINDPKPSSRVLAAVEGGRVFELEFGMNVYAKTEKGRAPRWKWNGMICPWKVTHWQPLPAPPSEGEVEVEVEE